MQFIEYLTARNFIFSVLITSLMLLIFVADLQAATEIYIGGLYVVIIMLSLWLPSTKSTIFFALVTTGLASIGYFISIYSIDFSKILNETNIINLAMTISAIWITTLIAIYTRNISQAIRKSETIHKAILNASIDPILIVNMHGTILSSSKSIEATFGWSIQEIEGKEISQLFNNDSLETYGELFNQVNSVRRTALIGSVQETMVKHRVKHDFPCEISINYINIPELEEPFFTVVLRDITIRKTVEQKMEWLLFHDELTQIYNRRYFNEQIEREWKRQLRSQEELSVIILDIDYFKNYNDYLGHQTGDNCLRMVAQAINASIRRSTDFVSRYGGEEFIIMLPNTNLAGTEQVAINIQAAIQNLNIPHPNSKCSKRITVSMGLGSMVPSSGCSFERLIRFADQALYQAKDSGRNKFCSYKD